MKKLMFILWVLPFICMYPFYNCNAESAVLFDEKDILREIYIQEDVPVVRTLLPLQVYQSIKDAEIIMVFNNPVMGCIAVQIIDVANMVRYTKEINADMGTFQFSVSDLLIGNYTIDIKNENIHHWIGHFIIE